MAFSSLVSSSLPFAIKTLDHIHHLHSKVLAIIKHLEKQLWSISGSWGITSISNVSCIDSCCCNITSSIKSIFSKMAASAEALASTPSRFHQHLRSSRLHHHQLKSSHRQHHRCQHQPQPSPSSSPSRQKERPRSSSSIQVIQEMLRTDPAYITPPSEAIKGLYDSWWCILGSDGADITTKTSEQSIIMKLINWQRKASVM